MISHNIPEVTRITYEKRIYSPELRKEVPDKFLRCNLSHDYKYEMNDNDVADQLRLVYRMQRFHHNFKWWWVLWLWDFEVSLVNAYSMLRRYEMNHLPLTLLHGDFCEKVGFTLLNPYNELPMRQNKRRSTSPSP